MYVGLYRSYRPTTVFKLFNVDCIVCIGDTGKDNYCMDKTDSV